MNQQTPVGVTYVIIAILGTLSFMCIGTMCACAVFDISIQESLMTALISLGSSLSGAVAAMLSNTRSHHPGSSQTETSTTSSSSGQPIAKPPASV